jgi:class 3 adenylate cyclase
MGVVEAAAPIMSRSVRCRVGVHAGEIISVAVSKKDRWAGFMVLLDAVGAARELEERTCRR